MLSKKKLSFLVAFFSGMVGEPQAGGMVHKTFVESTRLFYMFVRFVHVDACKYVRSGAIHLCSFSDEGSSGI